MIQLNLEDLHNPLALLNEQQAQERETDSSTVKKTKPELINMMLLSLLQLILDDKLTSMLSIRKGKVGNPKVFAISQYFYYNGFSVYFINVVELHLFYRHCC